MEAFSLIFNKPALKDFFTDDAAGGKVPTGIRIRYKDGTLQFRPSNTNRGQDIIGATPRPRSGFQAVINGVRVERYLGKIDTSDRPCFRLTKPAGNYGWIVATPTNDTEDSPANHAPLLRIWRKKLPGTAKFAGARRTKAAAPRSRPAATASRRAAAIPPTAAASGSNDFVFSLMSHMVQWFVREHPEVLADTPTAARASVRKSPVRRAKPKVAAPAPAAAAAAETAPLPRKRRAAKNPRAINKKVEPVAASAPRRRRAAAAAPAPVAPAPTSFQRRKAAALAARPAADKKVIKRRSRRSAVAKPAVEQPAPQPQPEAVEQARPQVETQQQPDTAAAEAATGANSTTSAPPSGISPLEEIRDDMSDEDKTDIAARNASRMLGREPDAKTVASLRELAHA